MLIIKSINIKSFGKFKDLKLDLYSKINIFYGQNEAGKSTIYAFLKAMFYGFAKPGISRILQDQSEYLRYKPWFNSDYGGSIILNHNEIDYLIFHDFNNNFFEIRNLNNSTLLKFDTNDPRLIGEYFLGMNSIVYEQLMSIRLVDQGKFEDNNYLKEYLLRTSYKNAMDIDLTFAENKILNENETIGTDRISNKKIGLLNKEIISLNDDLNDLYRRTSGLNHLKKQRIELKKQYKVLATKIKYYEDLIEYNSIENHVVIKGRNKSVSNEEYDYLLEIENYLLEAKENKNNLLTNASIKRLKNKYSWSYLLVPVLMVIIFIFLYINNFEFSISLIISSLMGMLLLTLRHVLISNKIRLDEVIPQDEISAIDDEIKRLENEKLRILQSRDINSIHEYLSILRNNSRVDYENLKKRLNYTPIIDSENIDDDGLSKLLYDKEDLKKTLIETEYKINALEELLFKIRNKTEELKKIKRDKEALMNILEINNTILEGISYAISTVSHKLNSEISDEASRIIDNLSGGLYTKLIIDDDLKPLIYDENLNNFVKVDYLSSGTVQIVYLALCLAINNKKDFKQKHPIILDESTNFLDTKRKEALLNYIMSIAENQQIIYFTNNPKDLRQTEDLTNIVNIIRL